MTDETKQDIENIATLALSTDEVQRRRAMCSLLGRVVWRGTYVNHELSPNEAARIGVLEADLREVTQQRDQWHQKWNAALDNAATLARDLAEARAELEKTRGDLDAARALRSDARDAGLPEGTARTLTREEVERMVQAMWDAPSYPAVLRWLEREGYLSVRLP